MLSGSVLAYLYPINVQMLQQRQGLTLLLCIQRHIKKQTAPQKTIVKAMSGKKEGLFTPSA